MVYRKKSATDQIYQIDIGSAQSVNSPKYSICAHQEANRSDPPNKRNNISIFDNINVRENFVEIDGVRYPRVGVLTNYDLNDYIDQYTLEKFFIKNLLVKNY